MHHTIFNVMESLIKMSSSESQGQEEVACIHIFRPTRPLNELFIRMVTVKILIIKCCN